MSGQRLPYNVLFLGHMNTSRSIMAEALVNREGRGRFHAWSAGIAGAAEIDTQAADILRRAHLDVSRSYSKSWEEFAGDEAPEFDFVFTVADEARLLPASAWPGQPVVAHWSIPNPALATGNPAQMRLAYAEAFRMLSNRIGIFMQLPLRSLDRLGVERELAGIAAKAPQESVAA